MAIEHDYFGLLSSGPDGSIFWSETVELGDQSVTVDLTAPDQDDVSADALDIAASLIAGLRASTTPPGAACSPKSTTAPVR